MKLAAIIIKQNNYDPPIVIHGVMYNNQMLIKHQNYILHKISQKKNFAQMEDEILKAFEETELSFKLNCYFHQFHDVSKQKNNFILTKIVLML